jgi:hypothetical protein
LFDAIAYLVPHKEFAALSPKDFITALSKGGVFYDLKSLLDPQAFAAAGNTYLAL